MKIVVLDGCTLGDADLQSLEALGDTVIYDRTAPSETIERIGDAQAVLTNKVCVTREVMASCPNLRYIGVLATGYNVVDIEAAREKQIVVTNVPGYSTQAVAQHTMALLLSSASCVAPYAERVKHGEWCASPDFCVLAEQTEELARKTLGIVGFGSIGQAVARAALGLDMQVVVYTRTLRETADNVRFVTLHELLACSDVISLHCPLTEQTRGILGKENIAKMKRGVRVINTARGPLIDEEAMADALKSGQVGCLMADVLSTEPPTQDNPLLHAPHVILTPHVAWAPAQTRARLIRIATENVRCFQEGQPRNVVS